MSQTPSQSSRQMEFRGALAIIIGAGAWGLFWLPLRYLNSIGMEGMWSVALVMGLTWLFAIPAMLRKTEMLDRHYALFGLVIGLSSVFYFGAVIYSDVVRVILLFYLLPIWATLLGRFLHGEAIPPVKIFAITLALAGLYLLLGSGSTLPIPQNIGDWFGIAAGFLWALALVLIRGNPNVNPTMHTTALFVFGAPLALIVALIMPDSISTTAAHGATEGANGSISQSQIWLALLIAAFFGLIVLVPSVYAQVWGARLLPSGTAALFTMSEILTATGSDILINGSQLSMGAYIGGGMIVTAALIDLIASSATASA